MPYLIYIDVAYCDSLVITPCSHGVVALMRVFAEAIVLTTKPRIDAYVLFTSKRDLVVRKIASGKTRITAISKMSQYAMAQEHDVQG